MKLSRILAGAALVAAFAFPSYAQHLGDVSLSTTTATLASAVNCTGSAQNYITGVTSGFSNIGQIRHIVTIAPQNMQTFRGEIDGIDVKGNIFRISDIMEFAGVTATRQGSILGIGYFAQIQVSITCSPNTATYTASYVGDFGTSPNTSGSYLTAQLDRVNFATIAGTVNQQDNGFQTPFGNSAGTLYFQFGGSSSAGNTLGVSCNNQGIAGATTVFTTTLANTTAEQVFAIPSTACPFMNVQYGAGGGGGTNVSAEMVFASPGFWSGNPGGQPTTGVNPCLNPGTLQQSKPINIVTATTTQIISLSTTQAIFVCGGYMTVASSGTTAATVLAEYGTGASCGTGTTALTGAMGTGTATAGIDGEPVHLGQGLNTPVGNAFCLVTAGTTVNVQGWVSYVQQ